MLGLFDLFKPKFVKRYSNLAQIAQEALEVYQSEIRSGAFPAEEHNYVMPSEELRKFNEWAFKANL